MIKAILKIGNAIYQFIVGDWIILSGITLVMTALILIHFLQALAFLRAYSALLLVGTTLIVLLLTLNREAATK